MTGGTGDHVSRPEITVLYITGWCRSGSTILGNVLNEVRGFFHVGELYFLWRNAFGNGSNTSCGCGEHLTQCPVWSKVLGAVTPAGQTAESHAREIVRLQYETVRTRHTWRVLRRGARPDALRAYAENLAKTYRAVADATGCHTIVDSGKLPAEAALLPHVEGIRPVYLHLVRDPRAVTHSWTKTKQYVVPMSAQRSTAYWVGFNLASDAILRRHRERSRFLRYEDFIAEPAASVDALLELTGTNRAENPVRGRTVSLGRNHTVTGNPDRFRSGPTLLRAGDDAWRTELPATAKAMTLALSWPLMGRYGYQRRPRRVPTSAAPAPTTDINDTRENALGSGTRK